MKIKKMYYYANSQILAQHNGIENAKLVLSIAEGLRNSPMTDDFKFKLWVLCALCGK